MAALEAREPSFAIHHRDHRAIGCKNKDQATQPLKHAWCLTFLPGFSDGGTTA
jgi:hypothetical protein